MSTETLVNICGHTLTPHFRTCRLLSGRALPPADAPADSTVRGGTLYAADGQVIAELAVEAQASGGGVRAVPHWVEARGNCSDLGPATVVDE